MKHYKEMKEIECATVQLQNVSQFIIVIYVCIDAGNARHLIN